MEPEEKEPKKEKKPYKPIELTEKQLSIPMKDIIAAIHPPIGVTITSYDEAFIYVVKSDGKNATFSRYAALNSIKKKRYLKGKHARIIYDEQNPKPEKIEYTELEKEAFKQATLIRKQLRKEARNHAILMEKQCRCVLEDMFGIKFIKDRPKWLNNLYTERPLELDIYNEEYKVAFEYQDLHHYQKVDYGIEHEIIVINDKNKQLGCIEHGVRLFCIPACDDPDILSEMIITIVGDSLPDLTINPKYKKC